jgi:Domain of unknown function (DUF4377)
MNIASSAHGRRGAAGASAWRLIAINTAFVLGFLALQWTIALILFVLKEPAATWLCTTALTGTCVVLILALRAVNARPRPWAIATAGVAAAVSIAAIAFDSYLLFDDGHIWSNLARSPDWGYHRIAYFIVSPVFAVGVVAVGPRLRRYRIAMVCGFVGLIVAAGGVLLGDINSRDMDLYITGKTVPCNEGPLGGPTTCLQVRWNDPNGPVQDFSGYIEGFNYQPGFRYHIRVKETPVENPPADAPSVSYRLIEVVGTQRAT